MRKIFTFLLSVLFVSTLSAQKPEATLPKAEVAPEIGGDIDEVWDMADENAILLPFQTETPTLGSDGDTWWKGLWVPDQGIYILVNVTDNDYYPYYAAQDEAGATVGHMYDQVELYFDCNYVKEDGVGGRPEGLTGHYQIAATVPKGEDDGTLQTNFRDGTPGIKYAYNASDAPNWFEEVYVPFSWLKDQDGQQVDIGADIGFDVTVIDGDRPGGDTDRQRAVWANDGTAFGMNESWNNMDQAGLIYLEGATVIYMEELILTGGDITQDNETFQIGIEIIPAETTDKTLKWTILPESTAKAKLSQDGVVTPLTDGVLYVSATSSDEFVESNDGEPTMINISGQNTTVQEVSYIVDGYNENPQENGRPNAAWPSGDGYTTHTFWVEDGVLHMNSDSVLTNPYDFKVRQEVDKNRILPKTDDRFIAAWKMWSAEETNFQLVLEQRSGWAHWGDNSASATPEIAEPIAGQTRWNLTVTPDQQWYMISFTPNLLDDTQTYDFGFQIGQTDVDIYMDSLYLIEAADSALINWDYVEGIAQNRQLEKLDVYPNPAKEMLNVTLEKGNTNVAIYNSVGVKMEELLVEGTHHVFNVSNYSPGLYFVKANNTVVKFVK